MRKIILIYLSVLLLGICCKKESSQVAPFSLLKTNWVLSSIKDTKSQTITSFPEEAIHNIYVAFTDSLNIMQFRGVCNGGFGRYSIYEDNKTIQVTDIATTKMACKYVDWERYVIDNLINSYAYSINGNNLVIYSKGAYNLNFTKSLEKF